MRVACGDTLARAQNDTRCSGVYTRAPGITCAAEADEVWLPALATLLPRVVALLWRDRASAVPAPKQSLRHVVAAASLSAPFDVAALLAPDASWLSSGGEVSSPPRCCPSAGDRGCVLFYLFCFVLCVCLFVCLHASPQRMCGSVCGCGCLLG